MRFTTAITSPSSSRKTHPHRLRRYGLFLKDHRRQGEPSYRPPVVRDQTGHNVALGDFCPFLAQFALDKLPTGRRLREMMNSIVFCVEGYDQDPREIDTIPEVRRFYTAFHEAWPYWLYFGNLETDNLCTMVMACLDNLTEIRADGQPKVGVQCDPLELLHFIGRGFAPPEPDLRAGRDVRGSDLPAHQGGVRVLRPTLPWGHRQSH